MATITMQEMQFYAHHGCFENERKVGTNFTVDLTFTYDATLAAKSDNIADAVNYAEVFAIVKEQMGIPSHLIENVAYRIKKALLERFNSITDVTVTLYKLNPPIGGEIKRVGVTL